VQSTVTQLPPARVFAWITGQDFNVGDSLLRRPYLAALARIGPVDVWIRTASPSFCSGLNLMVARRVHRSFAGWYLAMLASIFRGRTVVALNAGEVRVSAARSLMTGLLVIAGRLARIRGGGLVWVGASVPDGGGALRLPYRLAAASARIVSWRDATPLKSFDLGTVGADWGFATGAAPETWRVARPRLAIVMRGDRPEPSHEWLEWLRNTAVAAGLKPVVVVQVTTDSERARVLASTLQADLIDWPVDLDHSEQEKRVRAVYRESKMVVGDRLHGLIVGFTEGALPLGWVESSVGKIRSHFDAVGMRYVGRFEGEPIGSGFDSLKADLHGQEGRLATDLTRIRSGLLATSDLMMDTFR
jgi:hypothetical protein